MAGLDPAILARTGLTKDAIPVSDNPVEMAGCGWQHVQYVNS